MNFKENKTLISIIAIIFSIVLIGGGYLFVKKACIEDIKEKYKEDIEALKEIADFEKIDCNPFSRSVEITNIKAKDGSFSIEKLTLSNYEEDKKLKIPISLKIKAIGLETKDKNRLYKGNIVIAYKLDLKKEKLKINTNINITDEGKYTFNLEFGNVGEENVKILSEVAKSKNLDNNDINKNLDFLLALGSITLEKIYLKVEGKEFINRLLKDIANKEGITVEEAKREMINKINISLVDENLSEEEKNYLKTFKDYIKGKRNSISFIITKKDGTDTSLMKIFSLIMISPDPLKEFNNMFKIEIN